MIKIRKFKVNSRKIFTSKMSRGKMYMYIKKYTIYCV